MPSPLNLEGKAFNGITVLKRTYNRAVHSARWLCRCHCGRIFEAYGYRVKSGRTKSCGCKTANRDGIYGEKPSRRTKEFFLWKAAKQRAAKRNLEFTIEPRDVVIPDTCPLLGIRLRWNNKKQRDNSASIDRIDSTKGYIKGNVWVISWRANNIKGYSTPEELERIAANLKNHLYERSLHHQKSPQDDGHHN